MENYVKSSKWRGNKSPVVRSTVQDAVQAVIEKTGCAVTGRALYDASFTLLKSEYADDKLAGMILFREFAMKDELCRFEVLYPPRGARGDDGGPATVLGDVKRLFDDESSTGVNEWSTCDWLCMKVLGPYVAGVRPREARREAARSLMAWSSQNPDVASVWSRRAGHVSFVSYVRDKNATKHKNLKRTKKDGVNENHLESENNAVADAGARRARRQTTKKRKLGGARDGDDDPPQKNGVRVGGKEEQEGDDEAEVEVEVDDDEDDDDQDANAATGGDGLFGEGWLLELIAACDAALGSRQRFAQTGAGWVLRYCLLERREEVVDVLTRRGPTMTTEGMRYALEKCTDAALKKRLTDIVKSSGGGKGEGGGKGGKGEGGKGREG